MVSEVVKGKPLSKEETKTLVGLIESSPIILSKVTNATNNLLKNEEWIRVTDEFNSTFATSQRTPHQLRLKWENLKKSARKRSTRMRMSEIKTGGGPVEYIPPDDVLDRVASLLGNSDIEPEVLFVGCDDSGGENSSDRVTGDADVKSKMDGLRSMLSRNDDNGSQSDYCIDETAGEGSSGTSNQVPAQPTPKSTPRISNAKKQFLKTIKENQRRSRNQAIADYYKSKKITVEAKLKNILLQNEKLKLENDKLRIELEQLKKKASR